MSRASVVGMLLAAEVLIVGMALYALGNGHPTFAAGMHQIDFAAKTFPPVAAGAAPHVVVDDRDSRVTVGVSSDDLVHVRDLTQIHGAVFSSRPYAALHVERTPDGVRIERPHVERFSLEVFGFGTRAIEVDVPAASRIEIARCAGARVNGVTGGVSVHSVDGHVTLSDLQGSVDARSDDGYISASNVRGDHLTMESMDGHLAFDNVEVASLDADTHDGRIEANQLNVTGNATMQTNDGSVRVHLVPNSNLTIDASTRDGKISVDGSSHDSDDSAQRTIRLGAGTGRLRLATDDGSIHIYTNGAQ
jgi:hypothetical protein